MKPLRISSVIIERTSGETRICEITLTIVNENFMVDKRFSHTETSFPLMEHENVQRRGLQHINEVVISMML